MELVIVVAVSGLLMAISVPTIVGFQRSTRIAGTAALLASDLHYARSLATAQRATYQLQFSGGSYSLRRVSPPTTIRTRSLPRGVACTASSAATFYPWGLAGASTVTFADSRSQRVVRVLSNGSVSRD